MNSTKLFNFKFLKQNIKKSKGGIVLSLIIVPLLVSIYMFFSGINSIETQYVTHSSIGIFNVIFMYLIPFVYSVYLFGFVFKKPSTDFMNSMPINRKTMFFTNTLGGIILITLIQVITAILTFLWSAIFSKIIVFPIDILETLILCWTSYVFVFIVSNLAMTFSGTVQTQFVVTILILFLIPVCGELAEGVRDFNDFSIFSSQDDYDLTIVDGHRVTHYDLLETSKNYTMPFKLIRYRMEFFMGFNN